MEKRDLHTLSRLMTMSAADFLEEWFETEPLKATKATSGIIGTFMGVRSPGTGYVLLHHYVGELNGAPRSWGFAKGGTGSLSEAIASSARSHGVEIFTDSSVEKIMISNGRATGVALQNGDEFHADVVVSGAHAQATFLNMVDARNCRKIIWQTSLGGRPEVLLAR